jgi:D-arabinose 1-dehydrogenase-like Zn-dependent alcohol dehydrogenase
VILTGTETPLSIHQTYFRHLRIQGVYLGTLQEYREILALAAAGELRVPIAARHSLAAAGEALCGPSARRHTSARS